MAERQGPWAGVDVGGTRKGFDVAVVHVHELRDVARGCHSAEAVLQMLRPYSPKVVAVDSPCSAAPLGRTLREGERALRAAVCGIRWTPDRASLDGGNPYYEWIRLGFDLYNALEREGWNWIEVFPTASWTRWAGPRQGSRASWTTAALAKLGLRQLPARTTQDVRDAIAAAVTARQYSIGETETFESIVVPRSGLPIRK